MHKQYTTQHFQIYGRQNASFAIDQRWRRVCHQIQHRRPHYDGYCQRLRPNQAVRHERLVDPIYQIFEIAAKISEVVTLGIGQRVDVIVRGINRATGAHTIRSTMAGNGCSATIGAEGKAIAYYTVGALNLSSTGVPTVPNTTPWPEFVTSINNQCANVSIANSIKGQN